MKIKLTQILAGLFLLMTTAALRAQVFTVQHDFTNSPDGSRPRSLILAGNVFYSASINGGTSGNGMIFQFVPGGNVVSLYDFDGTTNGGSPNEILLAGSKIYGTTQTAGQSNFGTVFSLGTNGAYSLLYTFTNGLDGETPKGALTLAGTNLYGVTAYGGTNGMGTIFKIGTNGAGYAQLRSFSNGVDGQIPFGGLVLGGSTLYGTTSSGGTYGNGTIFKINLNGGGYSVIYNFSNLPDAEFPYASLVLNSNILYGTASLGGAGNGGAVFSISTNGAGYTLLHQFTNNPDGASPQSALTLNNSILYGTTASGGNANYGTVFLLNTNGSGFQILKNFTDGLDGANPESAPTIVSNVLWATAEQGGSEQAGTLFTVQLTPVILQQPQNEIVNAGSTANFTNVATGVNPLFYQWYFNTNTPLSGGTNAILSIANVAPNQAGYYTVVVTNNFGSTTSSPASLTVSVAPTAPAITQQPQNLTITNGNPASFTNVASGTPPLFYQWYFNTNTPVSGATNAVLILPGATTNQAGYYSVVVTNFSGSATSSPALLTVIVPQTPPVITQQPQNETVTNGFPASFTNVASSPTLIFYQWFVNTNTANPSLLGDPLAGQTNNILTFITDPTSDGNYYSVVVTNFGGAVTSNPALLTILTATTPPIITAQPQPISVVLSNTANFSVGASGRNPLRYQWYFNNNFANTNLLGKAIANQTNALLSFITVITNRGYYSVVVTNRIGMATSTPALLIVITNPVITLQPQSVTNNSGDNVAFTSAAIGAGVLKFQWYFQTNTVIAGATNATLNLTNINSSVAGAYWMIVTNIYGSATSSLAFLTVISNSAPSPPQFLAFNFNPANGNFSLTISNAANSVNRLWATTNLALANFWQPIATNVMANNGLWFFTDSNTAQTNAQRFYRASSP